MSRTEIRNRILHRSLKATSSGLHHHCYQESEALSGIVVDVALVADVTCLRSPRRTSLCAAEMERKTRT
eukprot:6212623-Pleurochrysis_carterae.AAC.1